MPEMSAARLLPDLAFPPFAYVPGRRARPPAGHVAVQTSGWETFRWGVDLFNHGYYWEAHEAWERLWTASRAGSLRRLLLKGLILLSAAGVKARQDNPAGVRRHAARAGATFRRLAGSPPQKIEAILGLSLPLLIAFAQEAEGAGSDRRRADFGSTRVVFDFVLTLRSSS